MKKLLSFFAVIALLSLSACEKNPSGGGGNNKGNGDVNTDIKIDGDFADWAALDAGKVVVAKNNPGSLWEAVKEIRVYATTDFIFYYVKFDKESVEEELANGDELNARVCLNTDGEFTSGYHNYFLQGYDFVIEGAMANGSGGWSSFGGDLNQRVGDGWVIIGSGMIVGAGKGVEYELMLDVKALNKAIKSSETPNHLLQDKFQTGMRFYHAGWEEFSNMPNASAEEGDGSSWGDLLEITVNK